MAKKTKATKYELTRTDIEEKLRELCGKLEDVSVFDTSANELDGILSDVRGELEGLSDDVHTKAY